MSARTLEAVAYYRGGEGDGGMLGGWSIFSAGGSSVDDDLLDPPSSAPPLPQKQQEKEKEAGDEQTRKRQKIAEARFGIGAKEGDGTGLESVVFALAEKFPHLENHMIKRWRGKRKRRRKRKSLDRKSP